MLAQMSDSAGTSPVVEPGEIVGEKYRVGSMIGRGGMSVVYDATLTRAVSTPTTAMLAVAQPVTILCGVQTFPMLVAASRRLAEAMPGAELVEMPASVGHRLDGPEAAEVVRTRLSS